MAALFAAMSLLYVASVQKSLFLETQTHLKEIAIQSANRIEEKINANMELLNTLEIDARDFEKYSEQEKIEKLSSWDKKSSFSEIAYVDGFGNGVTSEGEAINVSAQSYFKKSLSGDAYISGVIKKFGNGFENVIIFSAPVIKNNNIEGILYGLFEMRAISDVMKFDSFEGKGYGYVVDRKGNIVIHPDEKYINKNVFYEVSKQNDSVETQRVKGEFSRNESGSVIYKAASGKKYVSYVPIKMNGHESYLYAVTVVPYDIVFKQSKKVISQTIALIALMAMISLGVMAYILYQKKKNEGILKKVAYEDKLCSVLNRNGFTKQVIVYLQNSNADLAAIYMDIDNFKLINSVFGYEFGDGVLRYMAGVLTALANKKTVIGRLDGDNFCILTSYKSEDEIFRGVGKVADKINGRYSHHKEIMISAGIYFIKDKDEELEQIFDKAHLANKSIKYFRKEPYAVYSDMLTDSIKEENWLAEEMKKAIDGKDFEVYYQPKFELISQDVVGSEALIRWKHSERGFISPMEFIPLAEKTQLIVDIGRFVFEKVCMDMLYWKEKGIPVLPVAVNVSRVELYQGDIVEFIKSVAEEYQIDYRFIQIEITETVAMNEYENIKNVLSKINALGISISIDDFGSGYSSLGCLHKFKVDTLKLDRSFIANIENDKKGINILRGMIELARVLELKTVCEGIETEQQLEMLKGMDCKYGQGFIFARPMPRTEYEKFVIENKSR